MRLELKELVESALERIIALTLELQTNFEPCRDMCSYVQHISTSHVKPCTLGRAQHQELFPCMHKLVPTL